MSGQETGGLPERIAEAVRANFKVRPGRITVEAFQGQPLPLSGGEADEIALLTLQIVQPELDAADARHRDMLTGLRDATLRAETAETERDRYRLAWQSARRGRRSARFQVRALEKAFDRQKAKAETALTAFTSVRDELTGAEAERDRLREAEKRVREILDYFDGQVTALESGNPAVGSAFRFTFNKIRAALDQPADQPEAP